MTSKRNIPESGQAMVLFVLGFVALLGFTALAIDGGNVYTDRRHAQNAADASALAGALQKSNGRTNPEVVQAAEVSASTNGYSGSDVFAQVTGPFYDFSGKYYLVNTTITSTVNTSFAQVVFSGPLRNTVTASARSQASQPALPGYAIIGMGDCLNDGGNLISGNGGGPSGGVRAYDGGIFVNTPETAANPCAISPPNNGYGVYADTSIASVGSYNYAGVNNLNYSTMVTGVNGGVPIDDPLAELPEPQCTTNGTTSGSGFQPGNWNGNDLGTGTYAPGIYCINGDLHLSGDDALLGDGLVLYFKNGAIIYTGNAYMQITAPNVLNCLGTDGDATASCTYKGIAIFSARTNTSTIEVRGNGGNAIQGMVYALSGTLDARGGGNDAQDAVIIGQVVVGRVNNMGGGDVKVTYNAGSTYYKRANLSLHR